MSYFVAGFAGAVVYALLNNADFSSGTLLKGAAVGIGVQLTLRVTGVS